MHLHGDKRVYTGEPDEIVCECLNVERCEIEESIEAIDALAIGEVRRDCAAGGGCGSCHEEIARLILSRRFGETLDFASLGREEHLAGEEARLIGRETADKIERLLSEAINPKLSLLGVEAEISELGEEAVISIKGADEELKYTLSFWLDSEFHRRFDDDLTVIID